MSPPGRIPLFRAVVPDAARERLLRTIDTGWIGYGPECRRLEEAFMHGRAGWALATSSCTSSLYLVGRLLAGRSPRRRGQVIVPAVSFVATAMAFADREQFRILFLDKRNQLIADEVQGRGTVDHTPVYIREVVKRALELGATAMILVHNHPSGDPTPSQPDISMTKLIVQAAKPLGVTIHDHIIVGRQGHCSMKALGLF